MKQVDGMILQLLLGSAWAEATEWLNSGATQ
jgi:hypothetical protein